MKIKKKNNKPTTRFKFVFIIINSVLFSSLLVALITLAIVKSFELHSSFELFPSLFIGVPLLASGIVSLVITILASKNSMKELTEFLEAINKVAAGDFTINLNEDKSKVMGLVYKSFNRMVKELNSIEMLREDFISSFSHEFKTPIVSIKGFAKIAQSPDLSESERVEYLNIIIKEINRLSYLSSSTLLLTKLESQEIIIEKENYLLDEQIRQSIVLLQESWETKNIKFHLELDEIEINSNKSLLSQVWINIFDNAIKYSNDDTNINVSLTTNDENFVQVIIKDEGIGMTDDIIKHIFTKFYQADKSRNDKGIGLGLSIVKRIIELYGGDISVDSKLDEGSTFTINLPL